MTYLKRFWSFRVRQHRVRLGGAHRWLARLQRRSEARLYAHQDEPLRQCRSGPCRHARCPPDCVATEEVVARYPPRRGQRETPRPLSRNTSTTTSTNTRLASTGARLTARENCSTGSCSMPWSSTRFPTTGLLAKTAPGNHKMLGIHERNGYPLFQYNLPVG